MLHNKAPEKWRIKTSFAQYAQSRYKQNCGLQAGDIVEIDDEKGSRGHLAFVKKINSDASFLIPVEYLEDTRENV